MVCSDPGLIQDGIHFQLLVSISGDYFAHVKWSAATLCRLIKHLNHDKRSLWRRSKVDLSNDTSCCAACFASTPQIALGCLVRPTMASDLMVTPDPGLVLLLCQDLEFSTLVREVLRTITERTERVGLISRMLGEMEGQLSRHASQLHDEWSFLENWDFSIKSSTCFDLVLSTRELWPILLNLHSHLQAFCKAHDCRNGSLSWFTCRLKWALKGANVTNSDVGAIHQISTDYPL